MKGARLLRTLFHTCGWPTRPVLAAPMGFIKRGRHSPPHMRVHPPLQIYLARQVRSPHRRADFHPNHDQRSGGPRHRRRACPAQDRHSASGFCALRCVMISITFQCAHDILGVFTLLFCFSSTMEEIDSTEDARE